MDIPAAIVEHLRQDVWQPAPLAGTRASSAGTHTHRSKTDARPRELLPPFHGRIDPQQLVGSISRASTNAGERLVDTAPPPGHQTVATRSALLVSERPAGLDQRPDEQAEREGRGECSHVIPADPPSVAEPKSLYASRRPGTHLAAFSSVDIRPGLPRRPCVSTPRVALRRQART
jgi:hypothetical protein